MDEPETCLIVVAKIPSERIRKRRLASEFGSHNAYHMARAMLMDALERLSRVPQTRKILLYPQPEAHSAIEAILLELNDSGRKWSTQFLGGVDLQSSDLTDFLSRGLAEYNKSSVIFVGADCPSIPLDLVATAVKKARSGVAYLVPAKDGGYVLLALPQMTPSCVFDGVTWSAANTAITQLRSIMACGIRVEVGPTLSDIDTPQDIELLLANMTQNQCQNTPHTYRACLEALKYQLQTGSEREDGNKKTDYLTTMLPPLGFGIMVGMWIMIQHLGGGDKLGCCSRVSATK